AGEVKKGVRYKMIPTDENFTLRTYNYIPYKDDEGRERYVRSGEIIDVPNVQNYSKFEATVEATLPRAYIIPKEMKHIVDHLEKQGVIIEELGRRKKYSGEVFTVTNFTQNERAFEKHNMVQVEGEFKSASKRYGKGDYYVDMAQPLTNLIFYMLEPQSDDGLVTWNFFDEYFKSNGVDSKPVEYPIFKVLK
ncbi:unnamed protein product, partial [Chrysoparadoxa australica]